METVLVVTFVLTFFVIFAVGFAIGRLTKAQEVHNHAHNYGPETVEQTKLRMKKESYAICMKNNGAYPILCEDLMK